MRVVLVLLLVCVTLGSALPAGVAPASPATEIAVSRYNLLRTGVATEASAITVPTIRWTFLTNGTTATAPLAADLDRDGKVDVFFGEVKATDAADGSRLGYVLDGTGHLLFTVPMRFNSVAAAAADLDGDGKLELVFSEGWHFDQPGGIGYHVFRADGTPVWSFTTPFVGGEGFFASPALADVDGDGKLDLIAGSMDHSAYALRGTDGAVLWHTPMWEHYVRVSSPIADLDGDGRPEVTFHTEAGVVHTLDALTGAPEWTVDLGAVVAATPAVGDLDGDGRPDVVYALVNDGGVVALHGNGTLLWRQTIHDFAYGSPALVDVNGDGLPDVVAIDSNDPAVTAYRGTDGAVLWDVHLNAPWASGSIVAADVDGDGKMDLLVGSDAGLYALDAATGATKWFLPLPPIRGEPLVKDIDGDGLAEILVGAGDGRLYVIGTPPPVAATLRVEPRTLNLKSNGAWVNARIEFAEPVADLVDKASIRLEGVPADRVDVVNATTLHLKFPRDGLIRVLTPGDAVGVCATGRLTNGRPFRACDTIRVILPGG